MVFSKYICKLPETACKVLTIASNPKPIHFYCVSQANEMTGEATQNPYLL